MSTVEDEEITVSEWREILIRTTLRQWIESVRRGDPVCVRRALAKQHRELIRQRPQRKPRT